MAQISRRKAALVATKKKELVEAVAQLRRSERRLEEIRREREAQEGRLASAQSAIGEARDAGALESAELICRKLNEKMGALEDEEQAVGSECQMAMALLANLRQQLKLIEDKDL